MNTTETLYALACQKASILQQEIMSHIIFVHGLEEAFAVELNHKLTELLEHIIARRSIVRDKLPQKEG